MENKSLVRIIKAVATHCSKDVFRPHLTRLAVTSDRRIEATDGHRAIRVDTNPPHGLPVGLYEPKKLLALLKADIMPAAADAALIDWPTFDTIIPKQEKTPTSVVFVNPLYVAQSAEALAEATDMGKNPCVRIQSGTDNSAPMRLDATGTLASAVAVIMPVCA